jgi:nucleoside-diphosphate-sugar epimerase
MRIFVAGGTGAIGRAVVPRLVEAGHEVVATARRAAGREWLAGHGAKPVQVDVFDAAELAAAVAAAAPDAVVHQLTALSGGSSAENAAIRRDGTRNLVNAALAAGVGRIVAQSISWAYQAGTAPADESTPLDTLASGPRAVTVGGVQALEDAVTAIPRYVILRYGILYGPGTWYTRGGLMTGKLRSGELLANEAVSSFLHVDDAADAAVRALHWPSGPVNIVDDEPAPAWKWVPVFAAAVGEPPPQGRTGRAGWERGARNTRARQLGWMPRHRTWSSGFSAAT